MNSILTKIHKWYNAVPIKCVVDVKSYCDKCDEISYIERDSNPDIFIPKLLRKLYSLSQIRDKINNSDIETIVTIAGDSNGISYFKTLINLSTGKTEIIKSFEYYGSNLIDFENTQYCNEVFVKFFHKKFGFFIPYTMSKERINETVNSNATDKDYLSLCVTRFLETHELKKDKEEV